VRTPNPYLLLQPSTKGSASIIASYAQVGLAIKDVPESGVKRHFLSLLQTPKDLPLYKISSS
jgi:hypothetical protein